MDFLKQLRARLKPDSDQSHGATGVNQKICVYLNYYSKERWV